MAMDGDLQRVILDEVRQVRAEMHAHLKDHRDRQDEIIDDISKMRTRVEQDIGGLRTQVALSKQQGNAIVAVISATVSAAVAWLVGRGHP